MKKMLKKIFIPLLLVISLSMSGCSNSKKGKETFEFRNYNETYLVNEEFSIEGTKLVIKDKNGKESTIDVSEDMVVTMPDMTTAGEKTIVIEYNGKQYSFKITVETNGNPQTPATNPSNEYKDKLKDFLSNYQYKDSSEIEVGIQNDVLVNYFGNKVNLSNEKLNILLNEANFNDELSSYIYKSFINSLVIGSFDIDADKIINIENNKVQLDTIKALENFNNDLKSPQFLLKVINQSINDKQIDNFSKEITTIITENFDINSNVGYMAIKKIVKKYLMAFLSMEEIKIIDLYSELVSKINQYTSNETIKVFTSRATKEKNFDNLFSDLYYVINSEKYAIVENDNAGDYIYGSHSALEFQTSSIAKFYLNKYNELQRNYMRNYETLIKELLTFDANNTSLEEIAKEFLKANIEYNNEMASLMTIFKGKQWIIWSLEEDWSVFNSYLDCESGYCSEYKTDYDYDIKKYQTEKTKFTNLYNVVNEEGIYELLKEIKIIKEVTESVADYKEMFLNWIYENLKIESEAGKEEVETFITTYIDKLKNKEAIDVKVFIEEVLSIVKENTTSEKIKDFVEELSNSNFDKDTLPNIVYEVVKSKLSVEPFINSSIEGNLDVELIDRYAQNCSTLVKSAIVLIIDLSSSSSLEEYKNAIITLLDAYMDYRLENYSIIDSLETNQLIMINDDNELVFDFFMIYEIAGLHSGESYYNYEFAYSISQDYSDYEMYIIDEYEKDTQLEKYEDAIRLRDKVEDVYNLVNGYKENDNKTIEEYKEKILNWIYENLKIESEAGKEEVETFITTYIDKLKNKEAIDVKVFIEEGLSIVKENTTSEKIKDFVEELSNFNFDKDTLPNIVNEVLKSKLGVFRDVYQIDPSPAEEEKGAELIDRYAQNCSTLVKSTIDLIIDLSSSSSLEEYKNAITTLLDAYMDYVLENYLIADELETYQLLMDYDNNELIFSFDIIYVDDNFQVNYEYEKNAQLEKYEDAIRLRDKVEDVYAFVDENILNVEGLVKKYKEEVLNWIYENLEIESEEIETVKDALSMLFTVINYDQTIDYNQLFADIPLPEQIQSIDYNVLMAKLHSMNEGEIIEFSDVEVSHIIENGKFVGEVLTLNVTIDFDAVVSSIKGTVTINLKINY